MQTVTGTSAGDIQQMPFRVVDLFELSLKGGIEQLVPVLAQEHEQLAAATSQLQQSLLGLRRPIRFS